MSGIISKTYSFNSPVISVVVPTEGRAKEIDLLVSSLDVSWKYYIALNGDSRGPSEIFELLLVDSSDPPLNLEIFSAWDTSWMHKLCGPKNVRQKRNLGAEKARGLWVAFVDSDCVVDKGYLDGLLKAVREERTRAFAGRVIFRGKDNLVWRMINAAGLATPQAQTEGDGEVIWCATANLLVERQFFLEMNGFDTTLPLRLGADDVDFGLRLHRRGNGLRILKEASVFHPKEAWSNLRAIVPRTWRWGRMEYHLALRHRDRVKTMPPFFTAQALMIITGISITAMFAQELTLLIMLPIWLLLVTIILPFLKERQQHAGYLASYLGSWLALVYHLGTAYEYISNGSPRFLWEGLILTDSMEDMFPAERANAWSWLLAAIITTLMGVLVL